MLTGTDYFEKPFPNASNIVDFLRCSITYDTPAELLSGLKHFIAGVNGKKLKCVTEILRIKNGFGDILNWKSIQDCEYCDLKLNIVVFDENANNSMIAEVQLLLKWVLDAKKMGHKVYEIKRRKDFVYSVSHLYYDIDSNYNNYKHKINTIITNNDYIGLNRELLLVPDI